MEFGSSLADYEIIAPAGRGAYSYVYEAKSRQSGENVALKVVDKESLVSSHANLEARLSNEIGL
jgi:serine/threonine protein kinase